MAFLQNLHYMLISLSVVQIVGTCIPSAEYIYGFLLYCNIGHGRLALHTNPRICRVGIFPIPCLFRIQALLAAVRGPPVHHSVPVLIL